jgi:subtilase family serine protease
VTITGSNFPDDASVEFGGEPATDVTRESDTTLTATTPAHGAGVVDVAVSGGGGSAVLADAFTYVAPPAISSIAPGFGPTAGGTTITITGTGFTDTPAVHIGSLPATTITFVSDTTLTAVTPAHAAGPVDILLTNPDGQMVTETEGFVFGDADLTILNVPGLPKAGAGFDYAVAAKVKNLGPGPAPTSQVFFYLSTDSALNNGLEDRYLGSVAVPALAKNQVYRAARTVTIPPDTDAGSYYLLATADGLGDLAEAREDNNVRAKALTVGCNLLVPVLIAPRAADPGETIRITEVTKNSGPAAAPATQTELVLSTNTTLGDGDDIWLRARAIGSLNPLQSSKLVEMRTLPGGLPPGTYYLIARADREGTARETSEADNIKVRAITIR